MRLFRVSVFVGALALATRVATAADYEWPGRGTVSVDADATWKLSTLTDAGKGFVLEGEPRGMVQAALKVTLVAAPAGVTLSRTVLIDRLNQLITPALPNSTTKEIAPVRLNMTHGSGWYAQLSNVSLAGQLGEPRTIMYWRLGVAAVDSSTFAVISMQCEEPEGDASHAMLHMVESLSVQLGKPDTLQVQRTDEFYAVSVPESRIKLKIPATGIAPQRLNAGGATANPRYFYFTGINTGLVVSGWFESASRYSTLLTFWKGEVAGFKRGNQAEPVHVQYGKIGDWETIEYDTTEIPDRNHAHIRAELTRADTWIDLHVSFTADRPADDLHAELRTLVESLVIERK